MAEIIHREAWAIAARGEPVHEKLAFKTQAIANSCTKALRDESNAFSPAPKLANGSPVDPGFPTLAEPVRAPLC